MMEFDDNEVVQLVLQAKDGDKVSFDKLVEIYEAMVRKIAQQYVEYDEVNDFVQDVFIKAWKYVPSVREPEKFGGWLSTLANHMAIDYLRGKKSQKQRMPSNYLQDQEKMYELSVGSPEDDIIDQDNTYHIYDLMRERLDEKHYLCLILHIHGFSYEEIASRIDRLQTSSVPIYISQARTTMRPILEPLRKVRKVRKVQQGGKQ